MPRAKPAYDPFMKPPRIGFLGYDGLTALDLVGPMDAFSEACAISARSPKRLARPYQLVVIGLTEMPFTAESGLVVKPHETIHNHSPLDTLIIPGGPGSRRPEISRVASAWVAKCAPSVRRIVSVCTGLYLLAPSGLLDGRRVTTHWAHAADVARRFPKVQVEPDSIFIKSGKFYTSAGITAGIDVALALIEEDIGPAMAVAVARGLVVYLKRPGGQRQYSEPLRMQAQVNDPFRELMAWVSGNLCCDLTVANLAARTNMSQRHFARRFKEALGRPPAQVVEELRLDEARALLAEPNAAVERVARTVGFSCPDTFRRAFARRFGISPTGYRASFASEESPVSGSPA